MVGCLCIKSGLRNFLDARVVGHTDGRIQSWLNGPGIDLVFVSEKGKKASHPRGQSKLSWGLTRGTSDLEMKLPST